MSIINKDLFENYKAAAAQKPFSIQVSTGNKQKLTDAEKTYKKIVKETMELLNSILLTLKDFAQQQKISQQIKKSIFTTIRRGRIYICNKLKFYTTLGYR